MRLAISKIITYYLKSSNRLFRPTGYAVSAIGFIAAIVTLYQAFPSTASHGEQLRDRAAECRAEGYRLLEQEKEREATTFFHCAEQKFKEAISSNDALSLWGLANLYGDEAVQPLLAEVEGEDLLAEAAMYWCRARHASVPHAAGNPPFIENLSC